MSDLFIAIQMTDISTRKITVVNFYITKCPARKKNLMKMPAL
jgi:hypothetical protein